MWLCISLLRNNRQRWRNRTKLTFAILAVTTSASRQVVCSASGRSYVQRLGRSYVQRLGRSYVQPAAVALRQYSAIAGQGVVSGSRSQGKPSLFRLSVVPAPVFHGSDAVGLLEEVVEIGGMLEAAADGNGLDRHVGL